MRFTSGFELLSGFWEMKNSVNTTRRKPSQSTKSSPGAGSGTHTKLVNARKEAGCFVFTIKMDSRCYRSNPRTQQGGLGEAGGNQLAAEVPTVTFFSD